MKKNILFLILTHALLIRSLISVEPLDSSLQAIQEALQGPYVYHSVNVITGEYCESQTDLKSSGTRPLFLKRCYTSSDTIAQGWHFNHPNLPVPLCDSFEGIVDAPYTYVFDDDNRLIQVMAIDDDTVFNTLNINYCECPNDVTKCSIESEDGNYVHYTFSKVEPSRSLSHYLLDSVSTSTGKQISYTYCDHPRERRKLVSRRDEPSGRFTLNEYYDSFINDVGGTIVKISDPNRDTRIGKVKLQRAPAGPDNTPVITSRFFYNQGHTEVYDVMNNKTVYRYGKNKRLTAIENYLEDESLYRTERFFWDKKDQLISRTVEDSHNEVHCCQTFEYDPYGNIIKQTITGNLTGTKDQRIAIDENGQPEAYCSESYNILYRYSDDEKHLLIYQNEDNGVTTRYFYDGPEDRISSKLTYYKGNLKIRQFFEYDTLGNITANIVDDGVSEDSKDLSQVTERKISRFFPKQDSPGIGLPEIVEEKYLDLGHNKEILLKRTMIAYSPKGEVLSQDVYDGEGEYQYTLSYEYDEYGRLIGSTDSEGKTKSVSYDENGNQLMLIENGATTINAYDFSNRLIRTEKTKDDSPLEINSFLYDLAGNCIASVDVFGNETHYEYDALGRQTKAIYPMVSDINGNGYEPSIEKSYDIMDRITSTVDQNGNITTIKYNIRGKPTAIHYSDGSLERYEYNPDGSLKKAVSKNGCFTIYERDFLSRVVSEMQFTSNGEPIQSIAREYTSFHLTSESDSSGKVTHYEYDGAGRQVGIIRRSGSGTKNIEIIYDSKGQAISRKEWYGSKINECIIASIEKDESSKNIAFSIQNASGEILKRTVFNPEEEEETPPATFNYDYYNSFGQNVLQIVFTDNNGFSTIITQDALGRSVEVEKKNSLGQRLQSKEIYYDGVGNKVKEVHHILGTKDFSQPYVCLWTYGPENRMESYIEGFDTESERKTFYTYNSEGSLESLTKPDGTTLYYDYTPSGKPSALQSSDGTIDYTFLYDHLDRLTEVIDNTNHTSTSREYNEDDLIAYEKLANGMDIRNHYDLSGRRTELILPDSSKIKYSYDAAYLRSIQRTSAEDKVLYTHTYQEYSQSGRVLKENLIGNLGSVARTYGKDNLIQRIESKHWHQDIARNNFGSINTVKTKDPSGQFIVNYEYDELNQLTKEKTLGTHEYSYDSIYNRTKCDENEVHYNDIGQLTVQGRQQYSYDPNGNLIAIDDGKMKTTFEYDALNRLTKVSKEHDISVTYSYDPFNRRLSSTKSHWNAQLSKWEPGEAKRYIYDGCNEIGAVNNSGEIIELRVLGVGLGAEIGAAVAIEIANNIYAPIHDHRGSVSCLIGIESGKPVEWYRYSAFGNEKVFSENSERIGNPWKFSSKRIDDESGFIFFGQRYYNPETGRWLTKDPLGTPDSINRYAFNLNDPINRFDVHGLYSFTDFWNTLWNYIQSAYELTVRTFNTFKNHVSFSDYIRPAADNLGQIIFGKMFLQLSGFYNDISGTGIHGKGEISDKVRITLINGILNCRKDFKETLDLVSEAHGGANVHYIFDATDGWCWDILKCLLVKCGYVSPQAQMIANTWKEMIKEMGGVNGGGKIYHYAHSIGGTHTKAALRLMTPEEKSMIRIYTFGSPSSINDSYLDGVFNYMSVRDGVCLLDPIGFISGIFGLNDNIFPVGDWLGVPFVDHLLSLDGTYADIIKMLGHHFLQIFVAGQGY